MCVPVPSHVVPFKAMHINIVLFVVLNIFLALVPVKTAVDCFVLVSQVVKVQVQMSLGSYLTMGRSSVPSSLGNETLCP